MAQKVGDVAKFVQSMAGRKVGRHAKKKTNYVILRSTRDRVKRANKCAKRKKHTKAFQRRPPQISLPRCCTCSCKPSTNAINWSAALHTFNRASLFRCQNHRSIAQHTCYSRNPSDDSSPNTSARSLKNPKALSTERCPFDDDSLRSYLSYHKSIITSTSSSCSPLFLSRRSRTTTLFTSPRSVLVTQKQHVGRIERVPRYPTDGIGPVPRHPTDGIGRVLWQ